MNFNRSAAISIRAALIASALIIAACSDSSTSAKNGAEHVSSEESHAPAAKKYAVPFEMKAPSGAYNIDKNHAIVGFSVSHLGLSNYQPRFADFDIRLNLDSQALENSSIVVTIDPKSITTDYSGDYKATHKGSPFDGWDEALARDPKFFNADMYPEITFTSTSVHDAGGGVLHVTGDLTLLGKTGPLTLTANVVGAVAEHPFSKKGALGFSATGTFKRSDYGMTYLLKPPLIGDEVTLIFDAEFHQAD